MNDVIKSANESLQYADDLGFVWPDYKTLLLALQSELHEIEEVVVNGESRERLVEEVGDLLLGCIELCRYFSIPPEQSLSAAEKKFTLRFEKLMAKVRLEGKENLKGETFEQKTNRWKEAKEELIAFSQGKL